MEINKVAIIIIICIIFMIIIINKSLQPGQSEANGREGVLYFISPAWHACFLEPKEDVLTSRSSAE